MSTPMGPVEVGQAWYAHNRLGLNTLVCQAWGVDLDRITKSSYPICDHLSLLSYSGAYGVLTFSIPTKSTPKKHEKFSPSCCGQILP